MIFEYVWGADISSAWFSTIITSWRYAYFIAPLANRNLDNKISVLLKCIIRQQCHPKTMNCKIFNIIICIIFVNWHRWCSWAIAVQGEEVASLKCSLSACNIEQVANIMCFWVMFSLSSILSLLKSSRIMGIALNVNTHCPLDKLVTDYIANFEHH